MPSEHIDYFHYCPQCGTEYKCPCSSCDINKVSQHRFNNDGDSVTCKVCGFTASFDEMEDIAIMQYKWQEEDGYAE